MVDYFSSPFVRPNRKTQILGDNILSGVQTLSNKTLASPTLTGGVEIDGAANTVNISGDSLVIDGSATGNEESPYITIATRGLSITAEDSIGGSTFDYVVSGNTGDLSLSTSGDIAGVFGGDTSLIFDGANGVTITASGTGANFTMSADNDFSMFAGNEIVLSAANIVSKPPVTISTGLHVVTLGDSITFQANDLGAAASGDIDAEFRGYMTYLQVLLGFPFKHFNRENGAGGLAGDNKGVSGDTTTQMLARLQADVIDRNPDIVIVLAGTNDIAGGATLSTITSNLQQIYDKLIERGKIVVAVPILPRNADGASNWASAAHRELHFAVNNWIRDRAAFYSGRIIPVDISSMYDFSSATGDMKTGYTSDSVHLNGRGSYHLAKAIAASTQPLLVNRISSVTHPIADVLTSTNIYGNLISNADFSGTGGVAGTGISGTVADSFTVERVTGTNLTGVASVVAAPTGYYGNAQRIVISSTGAGAGTESIRLRANTVGTGSIASMYYFAQCLAKVGTTTADFVRYVRLKGWNTTNGNHSICGDLNQGFFADLSVEEFLGTWRTDPILTNADNDDYRFEFEVGVDATLTDSVTVDIFYPTLKRMAFTPVF